MTGKVKFSNLEGPERLLGSRMLEFELTAILGQGGMSVVYKGTHRITGQEVAIKILPPELATHDELKARFVEEARMLALLEHPNIVSLNNFVEAGGRLCLIMQFVDGKTFEDRILADGQVAWEEVLRIGALVGKALEYAHGMNVVHRDIKPSNIIIKLDGAVKVTDFGIAKMLGQGRMTSTGQTMGTVRYMSPEQVRGKAVDARSDIYSLGITLYEGLAGRTPFDGENQFDIMQQHLNKKVPAFEKLGVSVPPAIEKVLMRALEKDPNARYPDAASFTAAMESLLALPPPAAKARRSGNRWGSRVLALGLGVVVALAAGGGLYFVLKPKDMPPDPDVKDPKNPKLPPAKPKATFVEPHVLNGQILAVDQTFEAEGLRVQSIGQRDPSLLRQRYQDIVISLHQFMQKSAFPDVQKAASESPLPLTLVVVPQTLLDQPSMWPGFDVRGDSSYPSRYVQKKRTLFVADAPGFDRKELPYAVTLHVLSPIRSLSNQEVSALAEEFDRSYAGQKGTKESPK